jgi:hypothetical protein
LGSSSTWAKALGERPARAERRKRSSLRFI